MCALAISAPFEPLRNGRLHAKTRSRSCPTGHRKHGSNGPNRHAPRYGDGSYRLGCKEDWVPPFADKPVFIVAPAIIMITVLMSFAVLPIAPGIIVSDLNIALLFFLVHVLNALSHLGAAWLAKRIGLVRTMVFTHLPSSIFLIAASVVPSASWAVALFLLRESLVEMDVPTRQSYVAAVVRPSERTFASGVTNLTRNLSWATASSVAGWLMQRIAFSAPLFLGGGMKIVYDVLLWRAFRHLKPPEEREG